MSSLKETVYDVLNYDPDSGPIKKGVTFGLFFLIVANVIAAIIQTEPGIDSDYASFFWIFEVVSVAIFTIEYLLRVWSSTVDPCYQKPVLGRLRYMITPLAIVDMLAILPFYLPFFLPLDLRTLRLFRLLRFIRVFKAGRYSQAFGIFVRVFHNKREELVVTIAIAFSLLIISSSLMYSIEHPVQPAKFHSVLGAMWWAMATFTTIGYGDVTPITPAGRLLSGCIAFLGIALFSLPVGIFAAGFMEEIQAKKQPPSVCPHCGKPLDEPDPDKKT